MSELIKYTLCPLCNSSNITKQMDVKDHSISKEVFELMNCKECSFVFTSNIPTEQNAGPYYNSDNYISHSDTKEGMVNKLYHVVRNIMLKKKLDLVSKNSPNKNLLDVGCGTGSFLGYAKQNGFVTLGVEKDNATRNTAISNHSLEVLTPNDLLTGVINQKFGAITMWHVLEHLYSPEKYLQACYNLLDDKGVLIIAVPNCESLDAKKYQDYWAGYDVPRHIWHFTSATLKNIATQNGFNVVEVKPMPFDGFYVSMLSEKYLGSKIGILKGLFSGLQTYFGGLRKVKKSSSLIYVLKKRNLNYTPQ